jgi:hypothetical protein
MIDYSKSAQPKGSTKLDRAITKKAARLRDQQQLRAWARRVKDRDQWRDRKSSRRFGACAKRIPSL